VGDKIWQWTWSCGWWWHGLYVLYKARLEKVWEPKGGRRLGARSDAISFILYDLRREIGRAMPTGGIRGTVSFDQLSQ
jgi:hypothetical protein